ncbi:hypothetical protein Val02_16840 [Virgisporangium aliadipatigenens]|uniref:Uncharacterized protein n=1 Tax=Virgisporangium aliadipatigenens TaxID=741659 RepID=A0A8J3YJ09_9ACTN|nr:hypothetical protein Val02_16840 [Virgisporangium aliadipatigenens]
MCGSVAVGADQDPDLLHQFEHRRAFLAAQALAEQRSQAADVGSESGVEVSVHARDASGARFPPDVTQPTKSTYRTRFGR